MSVEEPAGFEPIWQAIKGWDIQREHGAGYHGPTGDDVRTILAALRAAGYAVVPVQPTKEMILAGDTAQDDCTDMDRDSYGTSWRVRSDAYLDIYRAMLAAVDTPGGDGVE